MSGYRVKIRGATPRFTVHDFRCPGCRVEWEESVDAHDNDAVTCPTCGTFADRVIGAPMVGTVYATAVTTAKSDVRPGPGTLDTSTLTEGETRGEWKKKRRAFWRDRDRTEWKKRTG